MPSSTWKSISDIVDVMMALRPRPSSVLDVGLGNGKYGFLCREYLHYWGKREVPGWQNADRCSIDGIEVFPDYVGAIQEAIYSQIFVGEAGNVLRGLQPDQYDLVLLIDVLEHFAEPQGIRVLRDCQRVGRATIISTPIAFEAQGDAFGNPHERHLSLWTKPMLLRANARWVFNSGDQNWLAVFSDDEQYRSHIRELSRNHSRWREALRVLLPYQIRSAFNRQSQKFRQSHA